MEFGRDANDAYTFMCAMGLTKGLTHDLDDDDDSACRIDTSQSLRDSSRQVSRARVPGFRLVRMLAKAATGSPKNIAPSTLTTTSCVSRANG